MRLLERFHILFVRILGWKIIHVYVILGQHYRGCARVVRGARRGRGQVQERVLLTQRLVECAQVQILHTTHPAR